MKKIILLLIISFFTFLNLITYSYSNQEIKLVYDKYYLKIDKKEKTIEDKIKVLKILDKKIDVITKKNIKKTHLDVFLTLKKFNLEKITYLEKELQIQTISKIKDSEVKYFNTSNNINNDNQLKINNFNINVLTIPNENYIKELLSFWYKKLEISSNFEYVENNKIYKIEVQKWYKIDSSNYSYFLNKKLDWWVILRVNNDIIITNSYTKEQKISYQEWEGKFQNFITFEDKYSIKDNIVYWYNFSTYSILKGGNWFYESDLKYNWFFYDKTLLIKHNDKYYFSNSYTKTKLLDNTLIPEVNKKEFLQNLVDDNKFIPSDYSEILRDIKKTTENITKNSKSKEEKIKIIYDYIISKIDYYEDFTNWNKQVFSWVLTYKNSAWVCDWYAKLFLYMLSYSNIEDVYVKRWFVYDNVIFPDYWHAWVQIWDYYYDLTFDDPLWNQDWYIKKYFKLPYELMYVDRFDWIKIPEDLKNSSLEARKKLTLKNKYAIYDKFSDYQIMKEISKRIDYWISYDKEINLETLKQIFPYYTVYNNSFSDNSWNILFISSLNYFVVDEKDNLEFILNQKNIDLYNRFLFKWYKEDWTFEYRLSYNVKFR